MRRREFIAGLGSAAAWPAMAWAQQAAIPVIGFLDSSGPRPKARFVEAFRAGLAEQGFLEGRNLFIEYRSAGGNSRLLDSYRVLGITSHTRGKRLQCSPRGMPLAWKS
jgi:hypothetical protein